MQESVSLAEYVTNGGVSVTRTATEVDLGAVEPLIDLLDIHRGAVFTSTYDYPGRYTRWDMGFVDPPLVVTSHDRTIRIEALNDRGRVLLAAVSDFLVDQKDGSHAVESLITADNVTTIQVWQWSNAFTEEERSRQPSVFSVLRDIISFFGSDEDSHLGLYGAFGYDLAFQFEPVTLHLDRAGDQRDLVLYLPDSLVTVDHMRDVAIRYDYEFTWQGRSTRGVAANSATAPVPDAASVQAGSDHAPGEYAATVRTAMDYFKRGDLFEVVPGQTFVEPCEVVPSALFRRLRTRNPAPYGAIMNLGEGEYLVSASPEMYVRVEGRRVETCPISGTIARGDDVLDDADRILELLNSEKDENELTMCTDVDRNDKSRVCDPSTIRVIGRRQIEMYSRLIHTVDHVEGMLLPQFDGLDAFLAHTWAVTVTGAPKLWAMRFIEEHEKTARAWYGGAIGTLMFNGNVNTGLTLRTIWIKDGIARVRAGATLLIDSDPEAEERETRTKASALLDAIRHADEPVAPTDIADHPLVGEGLHVLLVDHEDSFVHTLAGYLRRTGAEVTTVRVPVGGKLNRESIAEASPDFVVLSPGPGRPEDFHVSDTIGLAVELGLPIFGVCLGLQGIVEHFGGALDTLAYPAHGRASEVEVTGGRLFVDLPARFTAGRYHSLFADSSKLSAALVPTAQLEDGLIMAVEHKDLPIAAVQFHPESMMTMKGETGMKLIENFIRQFVRSGSR